MSGPVRERAPPALFRLRGLLEGGPVVLRTHRGVRVREGRLGLRDVGVDRPCPVDERLSGGELLLRVLPGLRRLFDLFLKLLAQGDVPKEPASHDPTPLVQRPLGPSRGCGGTYLAPST